MFKLNPDPTFSAPVRIYVPGKGMGQLTAVFKYLVDEERKAYVESLKSKTNLEAILEILVSWDGIDAPLSKENLAVLLNKYDTASAAFFTAYWNEITGAAAKN